MQATGDTNPLKKMKMNDPEKHHGLIRKILKKYVLGHVKSKRGSQRALQGQRRSPAVVAEVRKTIGDFKHTVDIGSSKGCNMLTKRQFICRMQTKEGMKKNRLPNTCENPAFRIQRTTLNTRTTSLF